MLSIILRNVYQYIRRMLYEEVGQILRERKSPSAEEWNQMILAYRIQENKWTKIIKKESLFSNRDRSVHIHVERNTCTKCNRPHVQDGLCLLHFQLRYSQLNRIGQERK